MSDGLIPAISHAGGPDQRAAGIGQVDIAAHLVLRRLADADDLHQRPLQALGDLRLGHDQRAAAVADDAAIQPVQRVETIGEFTTSSTVTTSRSMACGLCCA